MWPRRKRWSLMGSLAPPITSRFGVAAQEFYPKGNVPSPNYEFFDEESGGWSADKNNAAINAAMARQAQIPQYDHTMGAGAGSAAKKKGLSLKNMINAMSKMKAPTGMDFDRMAGVVGRNPKVQFDPMVGLNPNYDYSFGGLNFDPLKRQRKIYGSLV